MSATNVINDFALKLYNKLAAGKNENLFASPFSILTAMAMCHAGAKSDTASQLKDLLALSKLNDQEILDLSNKHLTNINSNLGSDITIKTANKIYPRHGFQIKTDFIEKLTKHFRSEIEQVDFDKSTEAAKTINDWVAKQTNDKIKDLVGADSLNELTRLVLVNAIYFKGNWLQKFDTAQTSKQNFRLPEGGAKQVDMMHLEGKKFKYFWHPFGIDANSLELPYVGEKISMTIILPEEDINDVKNSLERVESQLTPEIIHQILTMEIPIEKVNLQLPKFKLSSKKELSSHFKEMGATLPFDQDRANFTGINDDPRGLYISKVFHEAVVEVGEEGTEAAAATAVVMAVRMALDTPRDFICNRPFLFIIHEKVNDTILFIGKYSKPE
jgi:serpin B